MGPFFHCVHTRGLSLRAALVAVVVCAWVGATGVAYAYQEPNTMAGSECLTCHAWPSVDNPAGGDCFACHGGVDDGRSVGVGYTPDEPGGPHRGYTTTTHKCATCHSVHKSPADSVLLLPSATIVGTCRTCHDGTGGWGVYNVIKVRTGFDAGGGHSTEATRAVPGGDLGSGGAVMGSFSGLGGTLICTDCHSPHGADVVKPFLGERRRIRQGAPPPVSTKLLRRRPTGASASIDTYGSDWCLGCHAGRVSGSTIHNHPVESAVTWPVDTTATPRFVYDRLAVLNGSGPTIGTVMGRLGGTSVTTPARHTWVASDYNTAGNRGFLMPWPRTTGAGGQGAHLPICQQCHEDSRNVGDLAADGSATVVPFTGTNADNVVWDAVTSSWIPTTGANPPFQNFPHETENRFMVVEKADDLCLNCHPKAQLP